MKALTKIPLNEREGVPELEPVYAKGIKFFQETQEKGVEIELRERGIEKEICVVKGLFLVLHCLAL